MTTFDMMVIGAVLEFGLCDEDSQITQYGIDLLSLYV